MQLGSNDGYHCQTNDHNLENSLERNSICIKYCLDLYYFDANIMDLCIVRDLYHMQWPLHRLTTEEKSATFKTELSLSITQARNSPTLRRIQVAFDYLSFQDLCVKR